ncbi:MAG: hypothetical protein FJY62_07085 [Betaproteobacteria bacterium]|nr:hypothetical protein [Betaproteobacteria bacterium]
MFVAGVEGVHAQALESSPGSDYHVYVSSGPAIKDNPEFGLRQVGVARLAKRNGASYYLFKHQALMMLQAFLFGVNSLRNISVQQI